MFMFSFGLLLRFFMPCYFGNEIQHDYEELLSDVYNIDWIDGIKKTNRRNFLIIQENLKAQFQLKAVKVLQINLTTFLRILQSAYSLYAVLRQMNN